jgi:hypothetical protein
MATRRNLTDQDIMDLILESDSDACSSEDNISAKSDTDIDSDAGDTADTSFIHWTVDTNCPPVLAVH